MFQLIARPGRDPVVALVDLQDIRWRGLLALLFGSTGLLYFFPEQLTGDRPEIKQQESRPFYQPPRVDGHEIKVGVYAVERKSLGSALCWIRGLPIPFIKQVRNKSPDGMFTVVFFLNGQLGMMYCSPDAQVWQAPPYEPLSEQEEELERLLTAKSRGRLLGSPEDQRSLVAELSQMPGDFAVADGGDVFGIWIREPGSESGIELEIAVMLMRLQDEKRVPKWLTGKDTTAYILLGNFEVKTFQEYPGCLVLLYRRDFESLLNGNDNR
jgi:hypothetical protein